MKWHDRLWRVASPSLKEYRKMDFQSPQCSWGCTWFVELGARDGQLIGADWGVCANPKSPRAGMLTFEHMGCDKYSEKKVK